MRQSYIITVQIIIIIIINKNSKKALESDIANYANKQAQKDYLTGKISKGITNFQIETALKNINDEDLNDNFLGVFPANEINRFIDYKSMISEKRQISFHDSKHR